MHAYTCEWLETGSDGSFALACVDRKLRRQYHGLLTVREPGRGGAWNVLAEVHESVHAGGVRAVLSDPREGAPADAQLLSFSPYPQATHHYRVDTLAHPLEVERKVQLGERGQVELHYALRNVREPVELSLAPLLRCRPSDQLTRENPFLDGSLVQLDSDAALELSMQPYAGMPPIALRVEAAVPLRIERGGHWWTDLHYAWEEARGYAAEEDVFEPGRLIARFERDGELTLVIGMAPLSPARAPLRSLPQGLEGQLAHAARKFFMRTRDGTDTVVAGFPWFGPWGRDTLLALPGLYLATADLERTLAVLDGLLAARVGGLIPNIPALGDAPANTHSIDASLLFARTVQWLGAQVGAGPVARLMPAVCELLTAIADASCAHARFDGGIGVWMERGPWALTWMDALVAGQPVTPRAGYAVEIDALAYNAVRFALAWAERASGASARSFQAGFRLRARGAEADFLRRYWDDTRGYLADGHDGVRPDPALRPNQLFALGLPFRPIGDRLGRAALSVVRRELLTPAGLRTLSPSHAAYRGHYGGSQEERDRAYHQGTVWPWLLGIYADALRVHLAAPEVAAQLAPVLTFLSEHLRSGSCLGQVSEVFSGDAPHAAGGAPAQAWSVAELVRLSTMLESQNVRAAGALK